MIPVYALRTCTSPDTCTIYIQNIQSSGRSLETFSSRGASRGVSHIEKVFVLTAATMEVTFMTQSWQMPDLDVANRMISRVLEGLESCP